MRVLKLNPDLSAKGFPIRRGAMLGAMLCLSVFICGLGLAFVKPAVAAEAYAPRVLTVQTDLGAQNVEVSGVVNASSLLVGPSDTIKLTGDTVLNLDRDLVCAGIECRYNGEDCDLTIQGLGSLTINNNHWSSTGIENPGDLTIAGGTVLIATGGEGIYSSSTGTVTISGGTVSILSESSLSMSLSGGVNIDNADVYCKGQIYTTGGASKGITIGSGAHMTVLSNGEYDGTISVARDTARERAKSGSAPGWKLQINGTITSPEGASIIDYLKPAIEWGVEVPEHGTYYHVIMNGDEFPAEVKINGGAVNAVKTMITEDMVTGIEDKAFTGSPVTQAPVIKDGSYTLVEGVDYKLAYTNNLDAHKSGYNATVAITGIGKYVYVCTKTFKITPAQVTPEVSLSKTVFAYDGKEHMPLPAVKVVYNGKTYWLATPTDFVAGYSRSGDNFIDVGTYKVTVTHRGGKGGNFVFDPVELEYRISETGEEPTPDEPATPEFVKPAFALATTSYTYDGKVKTPTVTVKVGSMTLVKDVDYAVTYAKGRKNVGAYKVTVAPKKDGKYDFAAKTLSFKINPKGATIAKPAAAKKALTAKWKAQTKKMSASTITGYQVQVATNKAFTKNKKQVTVKGYKVTSKKISKLKAKTKYYVRVRTYKKVGKATFYSPWSAAKTVTTK